MDDDIWHQDEDLFLQRGSSEQRRWRLFEKLWRIFQQEHPRAPSLPFSPPKFPDLRDLLAFLTWHARKALRQDHPEVRPWTVATYVSNLDAFRRYLTCLGRTFSDQDRTCLRRHVKKTLPQKEGVSTAVNHKPVVDGTTLKDLIYFLWAEDAHTYKHPRMRVQLAFAILLSSFTASRPGAFIEGKYRQGTNEGLLYEDIKITLSRSGRLEPDITMTVTFRYLKHKQGYESERLALTMHPAEDRAYCPVTHYLALAAADEVYSPGINLSLLRSMRIPDERNATQIGVQPDCLKTPIIRAMEPSGNKISPVRLLAQNCFSEHLKELGERAGYQDPLMCYNFRRGAGAAIDSIATASQRGVIMGHNRPETFLHYAAKTVEVDIQSKILNEPTQINQIPIVSMNLKRNLRAPQARPCQEAGLNRNERRKAKRADLKTRRKSFLWDSRPCPDSSYARAEELTIKNETKEDGDWKHLRPARARVAELFFNGISSPEKDNAIMDALTELSQPQKPPVHFAGLAVREDQICPNCHKQIAQPKRGHKGVARNIERNLLYCLLKEARYTTARNMGFLCPFSGCDQSLVRMPSADIESHAKSHTHSQPIVGSSKRKWPCPVAGCHKLIGKLNILSHTLEDHSGRTEAMFCFDCQLVVPSVTEWVRHCEWHLTNLKRLRCAQVTDSPKHRLLNASLCIFCLGDEDLGPTVRWEQHIDFKRFTQHLEGHWLTYKPSNCPHPSCWQTEHCTRDQLLSHFKSEHGIVITVQQASRGTKRPVVNLEQVSDEPGDVVQSVFKRRKVADQSVPTALL